MERETFDGIERTQWMLNHPEEWEAQRARTQAEYAAWEKTPECAAYRAAQAEAAAWWDSWYPQEK